MGILLPLLVRFKTLVATILDKAKLRANNIKLHDILEYLLILVKVHIRTESHIKESSKVAIIKLAMSQSYSLI